MDSTIKQRWIEALRSGKYPQGQGVLEFAGKFCCLGVLCSIAVEDGVASRDAESDGTVSFSGQSDEAGIASLPGSVREWSYGDTGRRLDPWGGFVLGALTRETFDRLAWEGTIGGDQLRSSLSDLNDAGLDFDLIATIIEEVF